MFVWTLSLSLSFPPIMIIPIGGKSALEGMQTMSRSMMASPLVSSVSKVMIKPCIQVQKPFHMTEQQHGFLSGYGEGTGMCIIGWPCCVTATMEISVSSV
jgi:hypothetical protein